MKRLRLGTWSGQLLAARPSRPSPAANSPLPRISSCRSCSQPWYSPWTQARHQSSAAAATEMPYENDAATPSPLEAFPSPPPDRALSSAKLAALHARLSLPNQIPLQTLARTLIDPSADNDRRFNNSNLAFLGSSLLGYHATEWLICHYPRLPFQVMTEASRAFIGPESLASVARSWGVESVAEPGGEVDPGLLQFSVTKDRPKMRRWGYERPEAKYLEKYKWRRGIASRAVMDDEFGDMITSTTSAPNDNGTEASAADSSAEGGASAGEESSSEGGGFSLERSWEDKQEIAREAHADLVRALVGATYAHCGREAAKSFIKAHVLSRHLNLSGLFGFRQPTHELARLCAREDFEPPVARLLSETGRASNRPVVVVGIYSGQDKLGEGSGPNANEARVAAAINALKSWYLYSPGPQTRVPSDVLVEDTEPWEPVYIDIGEIL